MDNITMVAYGIGFISFIAAIFLYKNQRQFDAYFKTWSIGGILVVLKTLSGKRIFVHGRKHGNNVQTKLYGTYLLTGATGELEQFYGVQALFVSEISGLKADEKEAVALAVLETAVNDPNNKEIVTESIRNNNGIISKAVREESIVSYNRQKKNESGALLFDENDHSPVMETVYVRYPSLINTFMSEEWANILKRYIGILQNPYEISKVINITELETIEKMKKKMGLSEIMPWVMAVVIIIIVGILAYKMIGTGAGNAVVNAASTAVGI